MIILCYDGIQNPPPGPPGSPRRLSAGVAAKTRKIVTGPQLHFRFHTYLDIFIECLRASRGPEHRKSAPPERPLASGHSQRVFQICDVTD